MIKLAKKSCQKEKKQRKTIIQKMDKAIRVFLITINQAFWEKCQTSFHKFTVQIFAAQCFDTAMAPRLSTVTK